VICLLLSSALYAFAGVEQTQAIQAEDKKTLLPIEEAKPTLLPIQEKIPAAIETTEAPKLMPIEQGKEVKQAEAKQELPQQETKQESPKQEEAKQESPKQEEAKQESPKQEVPQQQQQQQQQQTETKQGKAWNDMAIESDGRCDGPGTKLCEVTRFNTLTESSFVETLCFDPSTHFCAKREDGVIPGNLLCPIGFPKLCGYQCYDPSKFTCVVHEALCPVSAPDLCGSDCFNKNFYTCKNGRLSELSSTAVDMFAGLSSTLTGCTLMTCITSIPFTNEEFPRCFDPAVDVCAHREGKLDQGALLCPISHPAACRDHCYDSANYVCHVESSLCPVSAPKLCGTDCFDPALWKCVDDMLVALGVPALKETSAIQSAKGSGVVAQQQQQAVEQPIESDKKGKGN